MSSRTMQGRSFASLGVAVACGTWLAGCVPVGGPGGGCDVGWVPAENDARFCCPADSPYAHDDSRCYPDAETADIVNSLRVYCGTFTGNDDAAIVTLVHLAEDTRDLGYSYEQTMADSLAVCGLDGECIQCARAAVDYVY